MVTLVFSSQIRTVLSLVLHRRPPPDPATPEPNLLLYLSFINSLFVIFIFSFRSLFSLLPFQQNLPHPPLTPSGVLSYSVSF